MKYIICKSKPESTIDYKTFHWSISTKDDIQKLFEKIKADGFEDMTPHERAIKELVTNHLPDYEDAFTYCYDNKGLICVYACGNTHPETYRRTGA